ncbi:hypothetical protein GOV08_03365 [Candidatus Woesearchaeota archaeon]|nr:hypothetical protein [Candidatus Woesearchaeota archaeon]
MKKGAKPTAIDYEIREKLREKSRPEIITGKIVSDHFNSDYRSEPYASSHSGVFSESPGRENYSIFEVGHEIDVLSELNSIKLDQKQVEEEIKDPLFLEKVIADL